MAKSDGSVIIDTLVDTKGFGKGLNTMQKQMGGLSKTIGKLGLAIGAAFAVGKLVQFGKEAIELGSDLQEVQNVVDVTFTTMSDKVNEFAQGAAEAAGAAAGAPPQAASRSIATASRRASFLFIGLVLLEFVCGCMAYKNIKTTKPHF